MFGSLLNVLTQFCLKFGHITVIFPIVVFGMIFHRRDWYAKAACFLLWVMIFNTLLKLLFKVPLLPHLGPGYAFPSGHMHATCAFYGYLLYKTNSRYIRVALWLLICSVGFSLIHCNFHNSFDIFGAIAFSCLEFLVYHLISRKYGDTVVGYIAVVSAVLIMIILSLIHTVEYHVWLAFYALVGMEAGLAFTKDVRLASLPHKILAFAITIVSFGIVYYLFKMLQFNVYYLSELRFLLIPLIIVGSVNAAAKLKV